MKNKSNLLLLSVLLGGLLFTYLFWMERLAINLLIYSIFIITVTFFATDVVKSTKFKIYASAHFLAALLVVINNSDLSLVAYYISMMLFVGFSHYQSIRTIYTAFFTAVLQFITVPISLIKKLSEVKIGNFSLKPILKPIKYIVLPIIILFIFTAIYSGANKVFAHYLELMSTNIGDFLYNTFGFLFKDFSIQRSVHFCFGVLVSGGLLIAFYLNRDIENIEASFNEKLLRIRRSQQPKSIWYEIVHTFTSQIVSKKLALKTEYIIGIISFIGLNLLLLSVNIIDISTLWFGYKPSGNFSANLHDGTNALIFSIILAMAVILYFFRGNLNFYSKSKTLKTLAFVWMVQNFILIISVFIKDGYYIEFYGLTYKRIGVLVFASLCIIGLVTVYLKIAQQRTLFYLFKINGNIWFVLLLAFSTINWDVFISKYNLTQNENVSIDADYLLSLSAKTLPILDKNRLRLHYSEAKDAYEGEIAKPQTAEFYQKQLDQRIGFFKERYEKASWLSWNLQDWNTAGYFGVNKK
jgi:hypothetical protein